MLFTVLLSCMLAGCSAPSVQTTAPKGYHLVWKDEFNTSKHSLPSHQWWYETGDKGWGNHELENYVKAVNGNDTCALVSDGTLKIVARPSSGKVCSVRMNTNKSWKYGYFEAKMKLPGGLGTWPAFWMMPKNNKSWPHDGEIDIMEEVGLNPNNIHCTIHCGAYNHVLGTQKGTAKLIPDAEQAFHVYAVEWTPDYIKGFIDGELYFSFDNDHTGNHETWPFDAPFYLKLNLAWGGDWGGSKGVDLSALPATFVIDYVRVYQK